MPRLKLAVLFSGSGSTLENLCEQSSRGALDADIAVAVSSRSNVQGIERAKKRGIPVFVVSRKKAANIESFSEEVFETIRPFAPDLIVLAGFMSMLKVPAAYAGKVLNIHPALLPAFGGHGMYGHHVHEAVIKKGCKMTGCTVHFVDDHYDEGPIIAQIGVEVRDDDTIESLSKRVQAAERELYPQVIQYFAENRVRLDGHRVRILAGE
jgi:formyltetrahydrofolate-dependent phosphoribosylglycinamide formyltransferase